MSEAATARADRRRLLIALGATAVILAPLTWMWWQSVLPASYSVMDMGYPDYGGGPRSGDHASMGTMHPQVSVAELTVGTDRPADVKVELVARKQRFRLATGREVDGYTLNGSSPGPLIRVREGQLVEVRLVNASVPRGITLHWHGVDVPNAEDGVAGVTQDAVLRGQQHTYRFIAVHAGSFWYHSHQVSHEQVARGLFGPLVITARQPAPAALDVTAVSHVYSGHPTVNGHEGEQRVPAEPGRTARVRVINTDNGTLETWVSGAPYRVVAVDGYDLTAPPEVTDRRLQIAAGGRADLEVVMPQDGSPVRVELGGGASLVLGGTPGRKTAPTTNPPTRDLDLLSYGKPAAIGFDPATAKRRFDYNIGRRPGFVHGRPGIWWSINGHIYPDVPMFVVVQGDVVRMTIRNHSGRVHPMHLHGHHAVVLSRNGVAASGSPWWVDSLDVASGDEYEIAFLADNPGIWMDHCHNLPHAQQGLIAHLMYSGVTEPYRIGRGTPNEPE